MRGLNTLAFKLALAQETKGWGKRSFGEEIALFHSELSEALEEYRSGHKLDEVYVIDGKPEGIPIELADVFIRMLAFCGLHHIDIERAIKQKIAFNETRPHRHGGKTL